MGISSFEVKWSRADVSSVQNSSAHSWKPAQLESKQSLGKAAFPNSENFLCCLHSLRILQCSPLHITWILKWQPIDCGQEEPKSWTTDYKFLSFQICSDSQAQKAVDCRRTFDCCLLSLRSLLCYSLVWSQVYWCNWFNPETVFPRINRSGAVWHSRSWNGVMRWVVHPLETG